MTLIGPKEVQRILSNEFVLDFLDIQLVQQVQSNPVVYSGPGSIAQDRDGNLRLKMYHTYESSVEVVREINEALGAKGFEPGKIIEERHYFSFEGKDMYGAVWRAKQTWLSGDVSLPAQGRVINAALKQIENKSKLDTNSTTPARRAYLVVPGSFEIPCNETERTETGTSLSVCKLNILGNECTLKKRPSYVEISLGIPSELNPEEYIGRVLEAIGISVGAHLQPLIEMVTHSGERTQVLFSHRPDASRYHLPAPIPNGRPHDAPNLQNLITKYIEKIAERYSPLLGYWYRVLGAFSGVLENRALVLSTAIEGLLKVYYPKFGQPDADFIAQVTDAERIVKEITIGYRAKNRMLSTLGNAKSATPKNALHALADRGSIPAHLIGIWSELRNKSTHADELKREPKDLQEFLDELHGCLELFYRLILTYLDYSASIICYSRPGWPESNIHGGT